MGTLIWGKEGAIALGDGHGAVEDVESTCSSKFLRRTVQKLSILQD